MIRLILTLIYAVTILTFATSKSWSDTITITAADRARMCTPNCRVCLCPFAVGERVHIHYGERDARHLRRKN